MASLELRAKYKRQNNKQFHQTIQTCAPIYRFEHKYKKKKNNKKCLTEKKDTQPQK